MSTLATLTGTYTIDPAHSRLGFVARHAMVAKVRGAFDTFEGTATIGADGLADTAITVSIDTASINTANAQRDEHLRSNDFLEPTTYPKLTFVSTSVAVTGEDALDVTGDLTIKDVTKSVTIPFEFNGTAVDPFGNARAGFEGRLEINRKDYNVTWNAPLEAGGVLVGEKVVLELEISAIKAA